MLGRVTQHLGAVAIGQNETSVLRQKLYWKIGIDRPKKAVAPLKIALPFTVAAIIGPTGFALHHPNLSFRRERHHIDPQTALRDKLLHASKATLRAQVPRNAARQKLPRLEREGIGGLDHAPQ